jgi:hypothetical protein
MRETENIYGFLTYGHIISVIVVVRLMNENCEILHYLTMRKVQLSLQEGVRRHVGKAKFRQRQRSAIAFSFIAIL